MGKKEKNMSEKPPLVSSSSYAHSHSSSSFFSHTCENTVLYRNQESEVQVVLSECVVEDGANTNSST